MLFSDVGLHSLRCLPMPRWCKIPTCRPNRLNKGGPTPHSLPSSSSYRPVPSSTIDSGRDEGLPWSFGYQINERHLEWDEIAARQLVTHIISEKSGWELDEVEERLRELSTLVPDLVGKLERMRVDLLVILMADLPGLTLNLIALKELLPGVNVSDLVARWPYLLLECDIRGGGLKARLEEMRRQLPGVRVELLVDQEPMMLKADIESVLQSIKRMVPQVDPIQLLCNQPQMVLDMNSSGMSSALDVEGFSSGPQEIYIVDACAELLKKLNPMKSKSSQVKGIPPAF